jgi:hypothetical protein
MSAGPEKCPNCNEMSLWKTYTVEGYEVIYCTSSRGVTPETEATSSHCSFAFVHFPGWPEFIYDGSDLFEQERYKRPT